MEKLVISLLPVILVICLPPVISQQQPVSQLVNHPAAPNVNHPSSQQVSPDNVIQVPLDAGEAPVTNHYPYQSSSLSPSTFHQSYPGSSYGGRDGWAPTTSSSPPYFGITGGAGWELSAYFGPVFWFVVIIFAVFGVSVAMSRLFMGTELFGGMLQRAKEATGKSLDLDNITNMVYQALDTYGKYAAKQARSGQMESMME